MYRVEAGANGVVFAGTNAREALLTYRETVAAADLGIGKLCGEPIALFYDGAILYSHPGYYENDYAAITEKQPWAK